MVAAQFLLSAQFHSVYRVPCKHRVCLQNQYNFYMIDKYLNKLTKYLKQQTLSEFNKFTKIMDGLACISITYKSYI